MTSKCALKAQPWQQEGGLENCVDKAQKKVYYKDDMVYGKRSLYTKKNQRKFFPSTIIIYQIEVCYEQQNNGRTTTLPFLRSLDIFQTCFWPRSSALKVIEIVAQQNVSARFSTRKLRKKPISMNCVSTGIYACLCCVLQ